MAAQREAQSLGGMERRMKLSVSGMKQPELRPERNCMRRIPERFPAKGVTKEVTAKDKAAAMRIRRGP